MKKQFSFISFIVLIIPFVFISCSSDDDDPWVPDQKTITYVYTHTIRGVKGTTSTIDLKDFTLKDILATEGIDVKNYISAEIHNSGSYYEFEGLKAMESLPSLRDITFTVGNKPPTNLGTCSPNPSGLNEFPSDDQRSTNTDLKLINSIFDDIKGGLKKAQMKITFTPTEDILGENIKINISIKATYRYRVYNK